MRLQRGHTVRYLPFATFHVPVFLVCRRPRGGPPLRQPRSYATSPAHARLLTCQLNLAIAQDLQWPAAGARFIGPSLRLCRCTSGSRFPGNRA